MADKDPTLRSVIKQVSADGYAERAQERKQASKTWWDLIFIPLAFAGMALFAFCFFELFWWLHVAIYPGDAERLKVLLGGPINLPIFLITILPIFGAMPLGFLASNGLMWLLPWARRASDAKAKGVKGASFGESQMGLFKAAAVLVPIALVGGSLGAVVLGR